MQKRSQTVPNHAPHVRDIRWGLDALGAVLAIVGTIVGATWKVSNSIAEVKMELAVEKAQTHERLDTVAQQIRDLQHKP